MTKMLFICNNLKIFVIAVDGIVAVILVIEEEVVRYDLQSRVTKHNQNYVCSLRCRDYNYRPKYKDH
jgi:hypothetical protein